MILTSTVRDKIMRILKAVAEERRLNLESAVDAIVGLLPDERGGETIVWCVREPGSLYADAALFRDAAAACAYFNSRPKDGPPQQLTEVREFIVVQWPPSVQPSDQPPGKRT